MLIPILTKVRQKREEGRKTELYITCSKRMTYVKENYVNLSLTLTDRAIDKYACLQTILFLALVHKLRVENVHPIY